MTAVPRTTTDGRKVGPPPPFDTELAEYLPAVQEGLPPDGVTLDRIGEIRAMLSEFPGTANDVLARDGRFDVREGAVPGYDGDPDVRLLIATPTNRAGLVPVIYFIHGGGMMLCDFRSGIDDKIEWADKFGTAVVSVDYRLAPENPHPAPVHDCYAGLTWLAENGESIGADPSKIVVVGESGGGGLAAAVTLLARDRQAPAIHGQMLICPMLDDRNDSLSGWQMTGLGSWSRISNATGWTALLGDARGTDDVSPYASPARADDLSNLPPTFIDVGSAETFRDEDIEYANRIWAAGGQAELHVWPGGFHGYEVEAPNAEISIRTRNARTGWLARLLGS